MLILTLLLSILIILNARNGILGNYLKNFSKTSSTMDMLLLIFTFWTIITFFVNTIIAIIMILTYYLSDISHIHTYGLDLIYVGENNSSSSSQNTSANQDPVRWWPSGTPQSWGLIGAALAVYRMTPGTQRTKTIAALGSFAFTIPTTVYASAVENPNGFNTLLYSMITYHQTGKFPRVSPTSVSDQDIDNMLPKNNFLPEDNYIIQELINKILNIFKPIPVEGYLDDLIGQQLFIHFLMVSLLVGLIIFMSLLIIIQTMYNNKDYIIKRFNNKYVLFYIRYQVILSRISLFVLPFLILFGLIELLVFLHFIITHPIPYEKLPIDLHTYIKK